jgi:excisionase family DNA binding protein
MWMKVPEAAEFFRVPRSRMYELIQEGEIPAVRLGQRSIRVNVGEVEEFLLENRKISGGAGATTNQISAWGNEKDALGRKRTDD